MRAPEQPLPRALVDRPSEDALRARIELLERAKTSIRVQALIFRADEAGLHIAKLLKKKRKAGLDVRVIVDAVSNSDFRTQWMYFDLKQHGIEVEGYEALYLHAASAEIDPDPRSARFNSETAVAIDDLDFVGSLDGLFTSEYLPRSVSVTWEDAERYHQPKDIASAFELLFALPLKDWL